MDAQAGSGETVGAGFVWAIRRSEIGGHTSAGSQGQSRQGWVRTTARPFSGWRCDLALLRSTPLREPLSDVPKTSSHSLPVMHEPRRPKSSPAPEGARVSGCERLHTVRQDGSPPPQPTPTNPQDKRIRPTHLEGTVFDRALESGRLHIRQGVEDEPATRLRGERSRSGRLATALEVQCLAQSS